jgi:hypothetical protein
LNCLRVTKKYGKTFANKWKVYYAVDKLDTWYSARVFLAAILLI